MSWVDVYFTFNHSHTHAHSLSLSLSHTHTHTHKHTHSQTLTHSYTHSHIHIHTLSLTHSHSHTNSHTHTLLHTHTHFHTHTHTFTFTYTHTRLMTVIWTLNKPQKRKIFWLLCIAYFSETQRSRNWNISSKQTKLNTKCPSFTLDNRGRTASLIKRTAIYRAKITVTCIIKYIRHTHLHLVENLLYYNS